MHNMCMNLNFEIFTEDEKMKFSNHWLRGWMEEYRVSLRCPNKRFAVSEDIRKERLLQFLKNIIRVRVYFLKKLGVAEVPIINGDQMPLHRNETASQKTMSLKDCSTYVKVGIELRMLQLENFVNLCTITFKHTSHLLKI